MEPIIVYSYQQNPDGSMDPQTRSRCQRALALYQDLFRLKRQGKLCIVNGVKKNDILLAEEMRKFFLAESVPNEAIIVSPHGLNTAGETDTCILILCEQLIRPRAVHVVSSWYHIPRILFLWRVRGWNVVGSSSYDGIRIIDLLLEPLKFLNSFIRPFASAKFS